MRIASNYPWRVQNGQSLLCEDHDHVEFEGQQIYEVIRLIDGKPLFFNEHLERLVESASLLHWNITPFLEDLKADMKVLIHQNQIQNDNVKLILGEVQGKWPVWTIFGVAGFYPPVNWYEVGVKTTLIDVERETPHAKVLNPDLAAKVDKMRAESDYFEALLVNGEGHVTEGSRSNVVFIKDQTLISPSTDLALKGITRLKLIQVLAEAGIGFEERLISKSELDTYDACILTGTSIDLLPVSEIDGIVMHSANNEVFKNLLKAYRDKMQESLSKF